MPALPQFDYIFAIATLFAFLDAWNIGMSNFLLPSCRKTITSTRNRPMRLVSVG
jgi:hypothetical protein